jgi:hypothetical protein
VPGRATRQGVPDRKRARVARRALPGVDLITDLSGRDARDPSEEVRD